PFAFRRCCSLSCLSPPGLTAQPELAIFPPLQKVSANLHFALERALLGVLKYPHRSIQAVVALCCPQRRRHRARRTVQDGTEARAGTTGQGILRGSRPRSVPSAKQLFLLFWRFLTVPCLPCRRRPPRCRASVPTPPPARCPQPRQNAFPEEGSAP